MSEEKTHWSPWSLAAMEECGERYRRMVKERERRPSGPAAARGRAVHAVAAESNRRKLAWKREQGIDRMPRTQLGQRHLPPDETREIAFAAFGAAVSEGIELSLEDKIAGVDLKSTLVSEEKSALAISESYVVAVAPTVDPVAVEREIIAPVLGHDFDLKGRIDLIDISSGPEMIRDTKTSQKSIPSNAADKSSQLTMYALLRSQETGVLVSNVALDNLVVGASGTKFTRQRSTRDGLDFQALINRIEVADAADKAGVFVPNTDSWRCSPKWCGFYSDCRFVVSRPVTVTGSIGVDGADLEEKLKASINPWQSVPKPTNNKGE